MTGYQAVPARRLTAAILTLLAMAMAGCIPPTGTEPTATPTLASTATPTLAPTATPTGLAPTATPTDRPPTPAPTGAGPRVVVQLARTSLGDVVADGTARTLYGFAPDAQADAPTCTAGCAETWPPVIVEGDDYHVSSELDPTLFSVVEGADGRRQLRMGAYPLYYFSGDSAAGQTNGQGIGDNWFVLDADGELVRDD